MPRSSRSTWPTRSRSPVHELSGAAYRHAGPGDAVPGIEASCGVIPDGGESAFELVWRTPLPEPVDVDGGAGRITLDGLAVVADVARMLGGSFETEIGERRIEAVLRLPNRLHAARDDGRAPDGPDKPRRSGA